MLINFSADFNLEKSWAEHMVMYSNYSLLWFDYYRQCLTTMSFMIANLKAKYHPTINSPEKETEFKARFAQTDKMIRKHNSDPNHTYKMAHNRFSSMVCKLYKGRRSWI